MAPSGTRRAPCSRADHGAGSAVARAVPEQHQPGPRAPCAPSRTLACRHGTGRDPRPRSATLADGRHVLLRPFAPDVDAAALDQVLSGMSPDSRWMRYHAGVHLLTPQMRRRLVDEVDGTRHAAWVVTSRDGEALGLARLVRSSASCTTAELALEVVDAVRGLGAGRELLLSAAEGACARGIDLLVGEVLDDNTDALRLVRRVGAVRVASARGVLAFHVAPAQVLRPAPDPSPHP